MARSGARRTWSSNFVLSSSVRCDGGQGPIAARAAALASSVREELCLVRGAQGPSLSFGFLVYMRTARYLGLVITAVFWTNRVPAQTGTSKVPPRTRQATPWEFNLSVAGYLVPQGQSYVSPTFTVDHSVLHLEARYNYEAQQTASLWVGYNWNVGKKLVLEATPMIGAVFGNLDGIAPGLELTVTYHKFQLYSANEYVYDTTQRARDFFYTWTQLTYSPKKWFEAGYVVQRTRAYNTPLDIQRGFLVELKRKRASFTTQVFNLVQTDATVVLTTGYDF